MADPTDPRSAASTFAVDQPGRGVASSDALAKNPEQYEGKDVESETEAEMADAGKEVIRVHDGQAVDPEAEHDEHRAALGIYEDAVAPDAAPLGTPEFALRAARKAQEMTEYQESKNPGGHVTVDGEGNVTREPVGDETKTETETETEIEPDPDYSDYPSEGTRDEVVAWAGDDRDMARYALIQERRGRNRSTVTTELERLAQ
jgi:hypothetical protein